MKKLKTGEELLREEFETPLQEENGDPDKLLAKGWRICHTAIDLKNKEIERLKREREWIRVNDRLPKKDSAVLIYTDHETVLMGTFNWEKDFEVGNFTDYYDTWKLEDVTHWMPLPPAPKEGE